MVLLVEGDSSWLRAAAAHLGEVYDVRVAADGSSAVQLLVREAVDVLVCGDRPGTMDGRDLLVAVGRLQPGLEDRTAFVVDPLPQNGPQALHDAREALMETGCPVLQKGLDLQRLEREVVRLLRQDSSAIHVIDPRDVLGNAG